MIALDRTSRLLIDVQVTSPGLATELASLLTADRIDLARAWRRMTRAMLPGGALACVRFDPARFEAVVMPAFEAATGTAEGLFEACVDGLGAATIVDRLVDVAEASARDPRQPRDARVGAFAAVWSIERARATRSAHRSRAVEALFHVQLVEALTRRAPMSSDRPPSR